MTFRVDPLLDLPARRKHLQEVMAAILNMLLGAALVTVGVLVYALADRIRQPQPRPAYPRNSRPRATRERQPQPQQQQPSAPSSDVLAPGSVDVIDALVASGYKKAMATQAVTACLPGERTTPGIWMAAALRRCAGGAS